MLIVALNGWTTVATAILIWRSRRRKIDKRNAQ
jgi:hypothetical protein